MKKFKKIAALTLCAVMLISVLTSCSDSSLLRKLFNIGDDPVKNGRLPNNISSDITVTNPKSYAELYKTLSSISDRYYDYYTSDSVMESFDTNSGAAADKAPGSVPSVPSDNDYGSSGDYSETNVQVQGVDEADVVKTDGKYIYALRNNELKIFLPDGKDTRLLSSVTVCSESESTDTNDYYRYSDQFAEEMFVYNGTVAVLVCSYCYGGGYVDGEWRVEDDNSVLVKFFDVSDPASPRQTAVLGQEGYAVSSRLIGDVLYLVSDLNIYDYDKDEPDTYVPHTYMGDDKYIMPIDCIEVMPVVNSAEYTVICSYSMSGASAIDSHSLLGGASEIYMNKDHLFVYDTTYDEVKSDEYTSGVYSVVDHMSHSLTEIYRYDVADGAISLAASGAVEGIPVNQFALDEYNGYLRIVTTVNRSSWSVYTDKVMGFVNYKYDDDIGMTNALYVLDGDLGVVGSITGLAENERVYSARFDGDIGYFVTFRNVDPLFAVDLSDPASPTVLSALKIPGFSKYLHVYGDGLLFGLGNSADENTGYTEELKLTMFDTTDPKNVTEKHTLLLDDYYSVALYNHKAILIAPDKNIIAFPVDCGYAVYGYSDSEGFYERALIDSSSDDWYWDDNARGLYIGSCAYIVFDEVLTVLDMSDFTELTTITF